MDSIRQKSLDSDRWGECDPVGGKIICDFCKAEPVKCVGCGVVLGCHLKPTPLRCTACRVKMADVAKRRCHCGAYKWPLNMAVNGHIGDVASRHALNHCQPRGADEVTMANGHAQVALTAHLCSLLQALQSDEADSHYVRVNPDAIEWRKRVKETIDRNALPSPFITAARELVEAIVDDPAYPLVPRAGPLPCHAPETTRAACARCCREDRLRAAVNAVKALLDEVTP